MFSAHIAAEELIVTDAAREKLAGLVSEADESINGVRVFVAGGGCNGMQYGMTFAEAPTAHDRVMQNEEFNFYVDAVAMNFLGGAEIDFVDDGINATFVFNNVFQAVGGSGACGGCGGAV